MVFRRYLLLALAALFAGACSDSESYEVGVIKPLMVVGVEPGGGDNVPLDTTVTATFSENVIEGTLTPDSVVLADAAGAAVAGAITYDAATETMTLMPDKPLSYSAAYTLTLKKTIKRKEDDAVLAKEFVHTFKTMDPPNLTVVKSEPSGGATSIGVFVNATGAETPYGDKASAKIVVTFSEGIDTKTISAGTFSLKSAAGVNVAGAFAWESSDADAVDLLQNKIHTDDILTFTPSAPLDLSTEYTVTIKGTHDGVLSKRATEEGGFFEADVVWTFRTIDPPPLRILWTSPSTDAVNVGSFMAPDGSLSAYGDRATQEIVIRFSEGAATDTVLANFAVYAFGTTTQVAGTVSFSSSGSEFWQTNDTLHFIPAAWDLSREYLVVLGKAAETFRATATGGQLGQDFGIQFETLNPPPLRVLWSSPSDEGVDVGTLQPDVLGDDVAQAVTIRFSEGLDTAAATGNFSVVDADSGNNVAGTLTFTNSGAAFWQQNDTAVFTPARWDPSRNYTVTVGGATQSFRATSASGALVSAHVVDFDMVDPLPLFLETTFPGNGAEVSESFVTDVNAGTDNGDQAVVAFVMYFSEPVNAASLEANFTFRENTVDITGSGAFSYSGGGTTVTFTPPALKLSSTYEVSLAGGSIAAPFSGVISTRGVNAQSWYDTADDTGGFLDGNQTIWFTTPDPAPLTITAISPTVDVSGNADNVARGAVIQVTFSEPVAQAIVTAIESDGPANAYASLTSEGVLAVPATYDFDTARQVLTITPASPLRYSTNHELEITGGSSGIVSWRATGVSGWLVPTGTTVYRFKTLDPATLAIWATSPSDQEDGFGVYVSDVAVDSDLQILFDREVDQASFLGNFSMVNCGASTLGCSSGSVVAPGAVTFYTYPSGAQKVTVDVGSLSFETFFEVTIKGGPGGLRSSENALICAATCEGGYLPADYTITFGTRSIPPLKVTPVSPLNGQANVDVRPSIVVAFGSEVSLPTLTQYTFYVTDVTNNQLVERFDGSSYYYASGNTAAIHLSADLDFDTEYNIVLLSSVQGTDNRFLGRDVRFSFHTMLASLVRNVDPDDGATGVELNLSQRDTAGAFSVYFDGAVTSSVPLAQAMSVTYVTSRGTVLLRGSVSAVTTTATVWTFTPGDFCTPGEDPLVNNATYYVTITDDVWRADGSSNVAGGFRSSFNTADFTLISAVEASSDVPGRPALAIDLIADSDSIGGDGKDDVPVLSRFSVTFAETIHMATLQYSATADPVLDTVLVRRSNGTYANLTNVSVTATGITFNIDDPATSLVANDLAFDTEYTIVLKENIRDINGNPLGGDYELTFRTSIAPNATLVPVAGDTNSKDRKAPLGVVFNVSVAPESLTDANFLVGAAAAGCPQATFTAMPALIDIGFDAHSAAVIPSPIMGSSLCHELRLQAGNNGPRDERGNPFPGPLGNGSAYTKTFNSTANDNGSATLSSPVKIPASGATNVTGRQKITAQLTPSATLGDVLVTTVNPDTFMVYSDAGRTVEVPGTVYYDPALESAVFEIAEGTYFQAGQTYYVKLSANISSTTRNNCTVGCTNYSFQVETAQPDATVGPYAALDADGPVTVTFTEAMRPTTILNSPSNLGVFASTTTFDGTTLVPGAWSLSADGLTASFTPSVPLNAGQTYTVRANTGAQDLAGNALVALRSNTFTVENTPPTVVSVGAFTGADQTIDVTFSEDVAIASVLATLLGDSSLLPGSLRIVTSASGVDPLAPMDIGDLSAEVFACAVVNGDVVTLDPLDTLPAATSYAIGVSSSVTDLGGTGLSPVTGVLQTRVTP
jgi:hypothetical protein